MADLTLEVRRCMRSAAPCGTYVPQKVSLPNVPPRAAGPTRAELEATVAAQAAKIKKSQETQNSLLYSDAWFNARMINSGHKTGDLCATVVQELRQANKDNGGVP